MKMVWSQYMLRARKKIENKSKLRLLFLPCKRGQDQAIVVVLQSYGEDLLLHGFFTFFFFSNWYFNPFLSQVESMEIVDPSLASPLTSILQIVVIMFFSIHLFMGLAP